MSQSLGTPPDILRGQICCSGRTITCSVLTGIYLKDLKTSAGLISQLHKKRFTLFPLKRLNGTQSCLLVFLYQVSVTTGEKHFTSVRFTIINLNERMTMCTRSARGNPLWYLSFLKGYCSDVELTTRGSPATQTHTHTTTADTGGIFS